MSKKICVAIDFSSISTTLLKTANWMAGQTNSKVEVIHISPFTVQAGHFYGTYFPFLEFRDEHLLEVEKKVTSMMDELLAKAEVDESRFSTKVMFGDPVAVMTEYQKKAPADLFIVGTRGESSWQDLILGSVTQGLIGQLPCPILALKDGRFLDCERVEYLSDFSKFDNQAVDWINQLSRDRELVVKIHHVLSPRSAIEMMEGEDLNDMHSLLDRAELFATDQLDKLAERFKVKQIEKQIYKSFDSNIAAQVVGPLNESRPDLVVLGTHGRKGPSKWLLGSNAEVLLKRIDNSLLILK